MIHKIDHHTLGEITVSQTWRAKRITVSVRPPGVVRLSLPYHVALDEALKFVESKSEWIESARAKLSTRTDAQIIEMPYATRWHTLRLNPESRTTIKVDLRNDAIIVNYPAEQHYSSEPVQTAIKKGIEEAWRIEAKEILPPRIAEIAKNLGLKYHSVTVRNTRSKWGSCSSRDDISLSVHLMRMPDHLIDYIIIHELCHTVHKNHSPRFHTLLDRLTSGRHKALNKEIKQFNTRW